MIGRRVERRSTAVLVLRSEDKQTASQAFNQRLIMRLLRASVGSTEAAKDVVARVGRIDRSIGEPPCARRCRRTDARNATVGFSCRLGFFPADSTVR